MTTSDRSKILLRAVMASVLLATLSTPLSRGVGVPPVATAQQPDRVDVLIGFQNVPRPPEQALVRGRGGVVRHSFTLVSAIAASVPEPALAGLLADPRVSIVELDGRVVALADTELDNAWGVARIGGGPHTPPATQAPASRWG
jgi:hypothetical protein